MILYLLAVAVHEGLLLSKITKLPVQKNKMYFSDLKNNWASIKKNWFHKAQTMKSKPTRTNWLPAVSQKRPKQRRTTADACPARWHNLGAA